MTTTCSNAGRLPRTASILATCLASSHTTTFEPEFPITHSHSSGELDGYTGTTTAPAVHAARLATVNSRRVLARIATRSPSPMPSSTNPRARSRIRSQSSLYVNCCQAPSDQKSSGGGISVAIGSEFGQRGHDLVAGRSSVSRHGLTVAVHHRCGFTAAVPASTSALASRSRPATRLALTRIAVSASIAPTPTMGSSCGSRP